MTKTLLAICLTIWIGFMSLIYYGVLHPQASRPIHTVGIWRL